MTAVTRMLIICLSLRRSWLREPEREQWHCLGCGNRTTALHLRLRSHVSYGLYDKRVYHELISTVRQHQCRPCLLLPCRRAVVDPTACQDGRAGAKPLQHRWYREQYHHAATAQPDGLELGKFSFSPSLAVWIGWLRFDLSRSVLQGAKAGLFWYLIVLSFA